MCRAFSCICGRDKTVVWEFGTDSHDKLLKKTEWEDNTIDPQKIEFCRIEISPKNGSYLQPDRWEFKIDMDVTPEWWTLDHKNACMVEFRKWKKQLYAILIQKPIIHPFCDRTPPEITPEIIELLRQWASVRDSVRDSVWASVRDSVWASVRDSVRDSVGASVRDSVWDSVWASVGDSVRDSVWASVWASVGDSVRDSVWASVWASVGDSVRDSVWDSVWASVRDSVWASVWASVGAYTGSFFNLPRSAWRYTETIECGDAYPFQPAADLWGMGLIPSFDGKTWRLHGGPEGKVLWEGEL